MQDLQDSQKYFFGGGPLFPKLRTGSFGGSPIPKSKNTEFFGGSPIPKSKIDQKVNIFVKTKNAPKGLKCKINQTFFFENTGSQKGGGGADIWGKFPNNPVFFYGERP